MLSDTLAIGAEFRIPERLVYKMSAIEKPPVYPGGEKELLKFIMEHIKYPYPSSNREIYVPSSVAVSFIIEVDGSVSSGKVLKGMELAPSLLDAIAKMPQWTPGMMNGRPVAVEFILPIRCIKWE